MSDHKLNSVVLKLQENMPKPSYLKIKDSDGTLTKLEYYDGENLCGMIRLTIYPGEKKYDLEVSSIRYYSSEKKCKLTGTEILKWLKKVKDKKIVKRIFLEDASHFSFPGSKIQVMLTRFRKFVFGQGWYESYGFISGSYNKYYQKSFLNFQRNSINNLCVLIYFLLKDILKIDSNKKEIVKKFSSKYKVPDEVITETSENVNKVVNKLFYVRQKPHKIMEETIYEVVELLYKYNLFQTYIDILYKFGVYIPAESGDLYDIVGVSVPNNTCILKALTPAGTRKIIDKTLTFKDSAQDTIEYIEALESILNMLGKFEILYVPDILELPGNGKTYKKTMQRCTSSYKKHSKR